MDKAVIKAFSLLEILARSDRPLGVTALAETADLGKSNVHRLLQTLVELKYVYPSGRGEYEATLRLWEFGSFAFSRLTIRDVARPLMEALSRVTRETVHLSELHQDEVLYIDKIESSEPVRAYTQLGGRAPAYCTATGKAMLAFRTQEERQQCIDGAHGFTPKTITSAERFEDEARQIRNRRFAINRGEWRSDIFGLAAPIVDSTGKATASIGISGPASRLDLREMEAMAPRIMNYAEQISRAMGCSEAQWSMLDAPMPPEAQRDNRNLKL